MSAAKKLAEYPRFGVTWFFRVTIHGGGTRDLGRWSSCSGLSVALDFERIKQIGVYDHVEYLPKENLEYDKIVLERAMNTKSSGVLRDWIREVADKWFNDDGKPYVGNDITITMFDNVDKEVMSWTFRNAIPIKWSGPQLRADESKVAIEKLELHHQGFLSAGAPRQPPSTKGSPGTGSLTKASLKYENDPKPVVFHYNPTHLKVSQAAKTDALNGVTFSSSEEAQKASGAKTFEIGPLQFVGPEVGATADKLFSWLVPDVEVSPSSGDTSKKPGATPGKNARTKKKTNLTGVAKALTLTVGTKTYKVNLSNVNVDYTRFTPSGVPIRATISLGLKEPERENPPKKAGSKGTSGGKVHTVTESENLPAVAKSAYGSPTAWRGVATANKIDDPLRVPPGKSLHLPGAKQTS